MRGRKVTSTLLILLVALSTGGCRDDEQSATGQQASEVPTVELSADALSDVPTDFLTGPWERLDVAIVDAPAKTHPSEEFSFIVELRNPTADLIAWDPCPPYATSYSESATGESRVSALPCDRIGAIPGGGRARLVVPMTAPDHVIEGEGGSALPLTWRLWCVCENAEKPIPMGDT